MIATKPWFGDALQKVDELFEKYDTMERFLSGTYGSPEARKLFSEQLMKAFPPEDGVSYMDNYNPGPKRVQLWQLSWSLQAGNRGMVVQEQAKNLIKLILACGFQTDANKPGVEQLVLCQPNPSLYDNQSECKTEELVSGLVGHQAVAFVKGWTRTNAALTAACILMDMKVIDHIKENELAFYNTFRTCHGIVSGAYQTEAERIDANRGHAMG